MHEEHPGPPLFPWGFPWLRALRSFGGLGGIALLLLSERPLNGAELMDSIEKMTWGIWRPSPGSVYPTLAKLVEQGLVEKGPDGRYRITEKGKEEVEEMKNYRRGWFEVFFRRPSSVGDMIAEMEAYLSYFEDMGEKIKPHAERIRRLRDRLDELLTRWGQDGANN